MRNSSRRILALTLGGDELGSSRVRVCSVLSALRTKGWETARVSAASKTWPLEFLVRLVTFDPSVVIIQKIAPPSWYCKIIAQSGRTLVFECDDAIQIGYGSDRLEAPKMRTRLGNLLRKCDRIIVSNSVLAVDFAELCGQQAIVFPGPAPAKFAAPQGRGRVVLWLGSPSTLNNVRSIVYPVFESLMDDAKLIVVGAEAESSFGAVTEHVWSHERQTIALMQARVGIAPQATDEWSRRKAFYKVLEYLAASVVPVVPDQPAVHALLGAEEAELAVIAEDDTPAAWSAAINRALTIEVNEHWIMMRDRVFDRWSADRLAQLVVADSARDSGATDMGAT